MVIENIKRIISEKGLKQGYVAEVAGFTKQEFSNLMNDRRKLLRVEHMMPIAEALGVKVNDLYYPPNNATKNERKDKEWKKVTSKKDKNIQM